MAASRLDAGTSPSSWDVSRMPDIRLKEPRPWGCGGSIFACRIKWLSGIANKSRIKIIGPEQLDHGRVTPWPGSLSLGWGKVLHSGKSLTGRAQEARFALSAAAHSLRGDPKGLSSWGFIIGVRYEVHGDKAVRGPLRPQDKRQS